MLEQIRVGAGAMESNSVRFIIWFINKNPITLYMAVESAFPFSMKRVVLIFGWQRLFVNDHTHYLTELFRFYTAFKQQFKLFPKACCINRVKHKLFGSVIIHEVVPHFIKRVKAFCRNFTAHHCASFFNGSDSFGIKTGISGFRVNIFSTNGAWVRRCSRGKGENHRFPFYFMRHINDDSAVSRNFKCLCDHGKNIT